MKPLKFDSELLTKRLPSGIDVETTLANFAIVTYFVEKSALRPHVHERYELDCVTAPDGTQKALISVVPFLDRDFRFICCPWPRFAFGQTNYRAYVTDSETGEHLAWFFGTSLDSWSVNIPHYLWKLPWHRGRIRFDTQYDQEASRYTRYRMETQSKWAPAELELKDTGLPPQELAGFEDLETGLVLITHPLRGVFYRRDGELGSYSIWHDRIQVTEAKITRASFPLLEKLELVPEGDTAAIHSVLIQPEVDFTIYLPPAVMRQ